MQELTALLRTNAAPHKERDDSRRLILLAQHSGELRLQPRSPSASECHESKTRRPTLSPNLWPQGRTSWNANSENIQTKLHAFLKQAFTRHDKLGRQLRDFLVYHLRIPPPAFRSPHSVYRPPAHRFPLPAYRFTAPRLTYDEYQQLRSTALTAGPLVSVCRHFAVASVAIPSGDPYTVGLITRRVRSSLILQWRIRSSRVRDPLIASMPRLQPCISIYNSTSCTTHV